MAMKVTKTAIHRLSVDMSCGCKMYAEFEDAQCKKPIGPAPEGSEPDVDKIFKACSKHEKDSSLSMLEFIIGERLDEAIDTAQKAPAQPAHSYAAPAPVDVQSSLLSGETVQSVAAVRPEIKQRVRPEDPTKVKTLVRGGGLGEQHNKMALDMDGVAEDENLTNDVEDVFAGFSDLDRDDERDTR